MGLYVSFVKGRTLFISMLAIAALTTDSPCAGKKRSEGIEPRAFHATEGPFATPRHGCHRSFNATQHLQQLRFAKHRVAARTGVHTLPFAHGQTAILVRESSSAGGGGACCLESRWCQQGHKLAGLVGRCHDCSMVPRLACLGDVVRRHVPVSPAAVAALCLSVVEVGLDALCGLNIHSPRSGTSVLLKFHG